MRGEKDKLPLSRKSITRKNAVGSLEFYITVGFYEHEPSRPGEVFINVAKEGSTLGGMCAQIALSLSIAFQYGIPWEDLSRHMRDTRFEPSGPSADGAVYYPSLSHAIAHTIDLILSDRDREVYGRHITAPPSEVPVQLPFEQCSLQSTPPPASGESH